ncbi:MAG: hypothetical protein KatS3mg109_0089 [Pirellulaceae bacterium]|nr:MAG: hypothetical protein KatS3mg109_0089 [Pirellulaceae bacterium]
MEISGLNEKELPVENVTKQKAGEDGKESVRWFRECLRKVVTPGKSSFLIARWDGGCDNGEIRLELPDDCMVTESGDPVSIRWVLDVENAFEGVLEVGSWAGSYYTSGNVYYLPEKDVLLFQGDEMNYEDYVVTAEWEVLQEVGDLVKKHGLDRGDWEVAKRRLQLAADLEVLINNVEMATASIDDPDEFFGGLLIHRASTGQPRSARFGEETLPDPLDEDIAVLLGKICVEYYARVVAEEDVDRDAFLGALVDEVIWNSPSESPQLKVTARLYEPNRSEVDICKSFDEVFANSSSDGLSDFVDPRRIG